MLVAQKIIWLVHLRGHCLYLSFESKVVRELLFHSKVCSQYKQPVVGESPASKIVSDLTYDGS